MKRVFEAIQVVAIIVAVYLLSRGVFMIIPKEVWDPIDLLLLFLAATFIGAAAKELANGKNS